MLRNENKCLFPHYKSLCGCVSQDAELKDVQPDPADDEKEDEEEEELVLLLSTLESCSRLDALPALASNGVYLVRQQLGHPSKNVRREAAAAMMALRSVQSLFMNHFNKTFSSAGLS